MIENLAIINARLPGYPDFQQLRIQGGIIVEIAPMSCFNTLENEQVLNVQGDWISLGGVDLQINGALGLAFPDLEEKDLPRLQEICAFLWKQGVNGFVPTIVTTSVEKIARSLSILHNFINQDTEENSAKVLGVHLEGPFLNPEKRGAHPQEYLLPLTKDKVKQVLGDYASVVKIITLAPELDPSGDAISYLESLGIIVSLGHSLATLEDAEKAFAQGASMVTHAFNAMPGLHHRQPGLLGAALASPGVYCGAIADGQHICPTMLQLLLRMGEFEKGLFLVSDALAPLGLQNGVYPWDSREIEVKNGTAKLPNGTLAGTTLPLLDGVKNLVEWGLCNVESAIRLATDSPRKAINLPGMVAGQPAHLLRWHENEDTSELTWTRI